MFRGPWVAAPLLLACACSPFDGYHRARDAGASHAAATDAASDANEPRCELASPPERPQEAARAGDPELEFLSATQTLDLGDSPVGASPKFLELGYDLDGRCSEDAASGSCTLPSYARKDVVDGPGGRDNALGQAIYDLAQTGAFEMSRAANESTAKGNLATVIRVERYNGLALDPQVRVSVYAASTAPVAGTTPLVPAWDGNDAWYAGVEWLDESALSQEDPFAPKYVDDHAYVVASTLVAHFDALGIATGVLSKAVMTARIAPNGKSFELQQGTFAGRQRLDEVLAALELVNDPQGLPICTTSAGYALYKLRACSYADLSFAGDTDGSAECDAASWAWSFVGKPMKLAGVIQEFLHAARCEPGTSPAEDRCATLAEP